jgi:hypothetical protein
MRRGLVRVIGVLLALASGTAMARTSPLRGVVEGYYGRPWSGEARRDVIRFLGARRMNVFVYGPKNDPFHRDRWREPYPADTLADLRATARVARRSTVRFVYALSPGLDMCYACRDDRRAVTRKLEQVARRARVRHFALFFDDAPETLTRPEDVARYGGGDAAALARAHAELVNRVDRWLRRRGLPPLAFVVPTAYAGTACEPYHEALVSRLRRRLPIGWTGPGVFSRTLTAEQARSRRACLGGHPVILWDNFPVNDTVLSNTVHLGPLVGRDPDLPGALGGYLLNPMTQAHASLIGLATAAAYLARPARYDPEVAWHDVLDALDPGGSLAVLAEQTRGSPLDDPDYGDAPALEAAVTAVEQTWSGPEWQQHVDALEAEWQRQAGAARDFGDRLGDTPLGRELAPWVAEWARHAAEGLDASRLLRAMKPSFTSTAVDPATGAVTGRVLPPDGALAAAVSTTLPAPPRTDLGAYLLCLGNITGADIGFCPESGLNVHGKALYVVPFSVTDVRLTTGRNVHHRLLASVAARYAEWAARQPAVSPTLLLTADGRPVALDATGRFVAPGAAGQRLVVTTAAGDATALVVTAPPLG